MKRTALRFFSVVCVLGLSTVGEARQLVFEAPPGMQQTQWNRWAPFTVSLLRDDGSLDIGDSSTEITVSISPGSGGALQGRTTRQAVAGRATFDDISYDLPEDIAVGTVSSDGMRSSTIAVSVRLRTIERVSVSSTGMQGPYFDGANPSLSADGRYVAFGASSSLAPEDTNRQDDLYVRDRKTGITSLVSLGLGNAPGNSASRYGVIGSQGTAVAFWSWASNLVPDDRNGVEDIFVRDLLSGVTTRASVSSSGAEGTGYCGMADLSGDGRLVVFDSTSTNLVSGDLNGNINDVFLHDMVTGETSCVSCGGSWISYNPRISADGNWIVFASGAVNLSPEDGDHLYDIYLFDRRSGALSVISRSSAGTKGNGHSDHPAISADGRRVAYTSQATNLVDDDTNGRVDIFVFDRASGETRRVSVNSEGAEADHSSGLPAISGDGMHVSFFSYASNLVPDDTNATYDTFVHSLQTGETVRVSVSGEGGQANADSVGRPAIDYFGNYVAFGSPATNLVPGETDTNYDTFVSPVQRPRPNRPPVASAGADQSVHRGSTVTLDGSGSADPDADYPLSFLWRLVAMPEGSAATLSRADDPAPEFLTDLQGDYLLELIVTDAEGLRSAPDLVLVSTFNTPPVASAGPDQSVTYLGTHVQLDGRQSYDEDGDSLTYSWRFVKRPEGSLSEISVPASATPSFVADVHGEYVLSLTVGDPWSQSAIDEVVVGFENIKPVADAGTNRCILLGETVALDGTASFDANGDTLSYRWSIVSQPNDSTVLPSGTDTALPLITPDAPGLFVLSLVVADGFEASDPSNVTLTVITRRDRLGELLRSLSDAFASFPDRAFKNANMRNSITEKVGVILRMIESGNYAGAGEKLEHDILAKTDGCSDRGEPDANDWIVSCEYQDIAYPIAWEAAGILGELR